MYSLLYTKCIVNFTFSVREGELNVIVNRVKELRAKYNMTQGDLAKRIGVTRQTIASMEKGSYTPSLLLAMNIAEVFEEPIEQIFMKEETI